tara:strand:+ start:3116 stop:3409 length:294 start_codon:yes stop_codon:yes gene_type:complete
MSKKEINFSLVTSSSLMEKVSSWDSYKDLNEEQFIDLISYSKELVLDNPRHKISFLIIAEGTEPSEEREQAESEKEVSKQMALRTKSKDILNSIYGI